MISIDTTTKINIKPGNLAGLVSDVVRVLLAENGWFRPLRRGH